MSGLSRGARIGAAVFVAGLSLAGPQAVGVAAADRGDDAGSVSGKPVSDGADAAAESRGPTRARGTRDTVPGPAAREGRAAVPRSAAATRNRGGSSVSGTPVIGRGPVDGLESPAAPSAAIGSTAVPAGVHADGVMVARPQSAPDAAPVRPAASGAAVAAVQSPASVASAVVGAACGSCQAAASAVRPTSAVAQSIRGLSFAAQHLVDTLGSLLSGLPGGPLTDLLAGALWTVRRTLWPVGADVGQWGSAACVSSGDCSGQDLSGADLRRQDLAAVNFAGANLGDADLAGANLTGAVLNYVRGPGAWLVRADLSEVHAADAYFDGANLHRATMINTDFYQSDFTGAVLTRAEMTTADASFAHFSDANLRGARLDQVDLWRADLTGADMRLVKWSDVTCPDGASSSTGCSGGPIMVGNQWYPTQPSAGFATRTNSWYEYRPVLRGTAGAPIQGQTESPASYDDDGVMGMVKNYSGQRVLIQAPSLAPFGLSQAVLDDGAEMPYMLFGAGELQFFPAVSGEVYSLQVNQRGYYYDPSNPPEVKLVGGGGTGATARAIMYDNDAEDETGRVIGGQVVGLEIITRGTGYTSAPTVVFEDGSGSGAGASAQAFLGGTPVTTVTKPAKLWLKDPTIVRPQSKFTPVGATDPTSEITGWKEGQSETLSKDGTSLWVKRESDGWRVPASEAYLKMYGNPNTVGTVDWAIFTIHIDKLG